jgi:hypothetical protein
MAQNLTPVSVIAFQLSPSQLLWDSGHIFNKSQVNQPCICDLNPMDLAWTQLKCCIKSRKYDRVSQFKGL